MKHSLTSIRLKYITGGAHRRVVDHGLGETQEYRLTIAQHRQNYGCSQLRDNSSVAYAILRMARVAVDAPSYVHAASIVSDPCAFVPKSNDSGK